MTEPLEETSQMINPLNANHDLNQTVHFVIHVSSLTFWGGGGVGVGGGKTKIRLDISRESSANDSCELSSLILFF